MTTLGLDPNKVEFAAGPDLKPTHDAQYWAAKTQGFDFSGEDRVPAELYNKILWEGLKGTPAPAAKTRFSKLDAGKGTNNDEWTHPLTERWAPGPTDCKGSRVERDANPREVQQSAI